MRYFFHLEDGSCIRDPKGEEFPDDAAALREAVIVAQELSKLPIHAHRWEVVVKDANGLRIGTAPLSAVPARQDHSVHVPPRSVH